MLAVRQAISVLAMTVVRILAGSASIESNLIFIQAMRPGVIGRETVIVTEAMLDGKQQTIVVGVAAVAEVGKTGVVLCLRWIRQVETPPKIDVRRIRASACGRQAVSSRCAITRDVNGGIQRFANLQMQSSVSEVRGRDHPVVSQLLL